MIWPSVEKIVLGKMRVTSRFCLDVSLGLWTITRFRTPALFAALAAWVGVECLRRLATATLVSAASWMR